MFCLCFQQRLNGQWLQEGSGLRAGCEKQQGATTSWASQTRLSRYHVCCLWEQLVQAKRLICIHDSCHSSLQEWSLYLEYQKLMCDIHHLALCKAVSWTIGRRLLLVCWPMLTQKTLPVCVVGCSQVKQHIDHDVTCLASRRIAPFYQYLFYMLNNISFWAHPPCPHVDAPAVFNIFKSVILIFFLSGL